MSKVVVTGATGFVGRFLCEALSRNGDQVVAVVRRKNTMGSLRDCTSKVIEVGDLAIAENLVNGFVGADCVFHLAGRAHISENAQDINAKDYHVANVVATKNVALAAARAGVRRLVFLSSIGVLGGHTNNRGPFAPSDIPRPHDAYAMSKYRAECALKDVSASSALETVIIRAPLIYGPGAKGSFARLLSLARSPWPLPLGRLGCRRSLIGIENLVDVMLHSAVHRGAAGTTLLVSDGVDLRLGEILELIAQGMGRKAVLFSVPESLLAVLAWLTGHWSDWQRISASLCVDISQTTEILGWRPRRRVSDGLIGAARFRGSIASAVERTAG